MDPLTEKYWEQIKGKGDFDAWLGQQSREELKGLLVALVLEMRYTRHRLESLEARVQTLSTNP